MKNIKVILGLMVIILLSSCQKERPDVIKVGYLPSLAASQLYVGIANGYFSEENIMIEIQEIYSGPDIINALQSKSVDIAFGITPPLITARNKGIKVKSISGATYDSGEIREHRLMLQKDSKIRKPTDLIGKKIAVVAEGTSDYFGLLEYLDGNGVDKDDVEIIKTPHPEMIISIKGKFVDAAAGIEPFITMGMINKDVKVFDYYYPNEKIEVGTYLAHDDFIKTNRAIVKRFNAAIKKSTDFIKNEKKFRELLPTLESYGIKFKLSKDVESSVRIMGFDYHVTEDGLNRIKKQLLKYGYIDKNIDVKECIYDSDR